MHVHHESQEKPEAQTAVAFNDISSPPRNAFEREDHSFDCVDLEVTTSSAGKVEVGVAGEGGRLEVSNAEFVAATFPVLPQAAFAAVCAKGGDPGEGGWIAQRAERVVGELSAADNNYVGCSSFYVSPDGTFKARKAQFAACHFLLLDDLAGC